MIFYDQNNSQFSGTEREVGQMDTNAQTNKQDWIPLINKWKIER